MNRYRGTSAGEAARGHFAVGPLLLGADDRDRVGVDQDRVRPVLDLGLLVAQLGDEPLLAGGARDAVEGQQRVAVQQQDLAQPAAGGRDQQQDPHRLLVPDAAVLDRLAEQLDVGHDPAHRGVVDDLALIDPRRNARLLAEPVEAGVNRAEPVPPLVRESAGRVVAMVEHEHVELLDVAHQRSDPLDAELPIVALALRGADRVEVAEVVEHQWADRERVLAQVGLIDGPARRGSG